MIFGDPEKIIDQVLRTIVICKHHTDDVKSLIDKSSGRENSGEFKQFEEHHLQTLYGLFIGIITLCIW